MAFLRSPSKTAAPPGAAEWIAKNWSDKDGNGWNDVWEWVFPEVQSRDLTSDADGDGMTCYEEMLRGITPVRKLPRPGYLDKNKDGWEDAWAGKFPAHIADKKGDPDGDGITNWIEMLDGSDPGRANKPGEVHRSAEELARQAEGAALTKEANEKMWAARKADLDRLAAPELPAGTIETELMQLKVVDALKQKAAHLDIQQRQSAELTQAKAALQHMGLAESQTKSDGSSGVVAGLVGSQPVFAHANNLVAADSISTDEVRAGGSLGLNLDGTGMKVGLWEIADPETTHIEFAISGGSKVTDMDGTSSQAGLQDRYHATHVSGTLAATGDDADARGMAAGALLQAYDQGNDLTEMSGMFANQTTADDVLISNHSYGTFLGWRAASYNFNGNNIPWWDGDLAFSGTQDYKFGYYDTRSQSVDQTTYARKTYLPVWSAGNDRFQPNLVTYGNQFVAYSSAINPPGYYVFSGTYPPVDGGATGYDTTGAYGVAKNILTVASVADIVGGYAGTATASSFSSAGPTDDGRIKPDIAANGETVYSSIDGGYATASGTSQAAPSITGSLALLTQQFSQLYGSTRLPWASTLKALVIHTADDVGAVGPDYRLGWGLMNTKKAAQLLAIDGANGNSPFFRELTLANGGSLNLAFKAIGGSGNPIKVTIVWTDPAATPLSPSLNNSSARLINDVNLKVIKPDSTTAYPFVLDRLNPANAATTGTNAVDNVEQVIIASPTAGATYTVNIAPATGETFVNESGQAASQQVSVFVSGVVVELFQPTVAQTGATTYTLSWPGALGATYRVETTTNLTSWTEVSGDIVAAANETITHTPSNTSEQRRFWRIKRVN